MSWIGSIDWTGVLAFWAGINIGFVAGAIWNGMFRRGEPQTSVGHSREV